MTGGINDTKKVKSIMGKRVKLAREKQKLSRPDFADKLSDHHAAPTINSIKENVTVDRLKQWEYGNNPINLEWIPAICDVLKCDTGYLFGEYEELTWQGADIHAKTGLSEGAVHVLESLDFVFGNSHFKMTEQGKLSKQELMSRIIEDNRLRDLLVSLQSAKTAEFNTRFSQEGQFTGKDFLQAEDVFRAANMVALKGEDAVAFYLQNATKIFTDIIYSISVNFSQENAYSTEIVDLDKKAAEAGD